MNESRRKKYIQEYLNGHQPFDYLGTKRYSTLVVGLRDCRGNTKRNIDGVYDETKTGDTGNWLGCIGYFTILDQIGSCFKRLDIPSPNSNHNKIYFAIKEFGYDLIDDNERQLFALIALRNAFTHDFNLLNKPNNPDRNHLEQHKFVVTDDKDSWVVRLPEELWDGNIEGKDFSNTLDATYVNLFGFGILVETIYSRLCKFHEENNLGIKMSTKELLNKYTFVINK